MIGAVMLVMIDKAKLYTFVREKASQDLERYVSSGRRFRSLDDAALLARFSQAWEELAEDPSSEERWTTASDVGFEADLRGAEMPYDVAEGAMARISTAMAEATERLTADPMALDDANRRLIEDIETTTDRIKSAPKH